MRVWADSLAKGLYDGKEVKEYIMVLLIKRHIKEKRSQRHGLEYLGN